MSTSLFTCPVDGASCEVADAVFQRCLRPSSRAAERVRDAISHVSSDLPCFRCREAERAVESLRRTRFGKHERNILAHSPNPQAQSGAILDPELSTHSDRETYLRAIRKLSRMGLLDASRRFVRMQTTSKRKDGSPIARAYAHRTLRQTELGALVVKYYRDDMESGRAIRWSRHLDSIRQEARWPVEDLLVLFTEALEKQLVQLALQAEQVGPEAREARQLRYLLQPIWDALQSRS